MYVSVERRSGHKTMQIIILDDGTTHKDDILAELNRRGATYENANGKLFALDFKPGVSWDSAKAYLDEAFDKNWLEYRWSAS